MVHPVIPKEVVWRDACGIGSQWQEFFAYFIEVIYIIGSILFTLGSAYFIPGGDKRFELLGCRLYDAGSLIFAAGASFYLFESAYCHKKRFVEVLQDSELFDQSLYFVGSVIFLLGTLIWDPDIFWVLERFGGRLLWLGIADGLFMFGSLLFAFASFWTALSIYKVHTLFKNYALVITTCYEFGGFLFIAGTMAFIPGFDCNENLPRLGGVAYLVGSLLYTLGTVLSFFKTVATYQANKEQTHAAGVVQSVWRRQRAFTHLASKSRGEPEPRDDGDATAVPKPSLKVLKRVQQATIRLQRLVRAKQAHAEKTACCVADALRQESCVTHVAHHAATPRSSDWKLLSCFEDDDAAGGPRLCDVLSRALPTASWFCSGGWRRGEDAWVPMQRMGNSASFQLITPEMDADHLL